MDISPLLRVIRVSFLMVLMSVAACSLFPSGPQGNSLLGGIQDSSAPLLNHSILPVVNAPTSLEDVTDFSYELSIQDLGPTTHALVIHSHVPLTEADVFNKGDRYSVTLLPDRLILARSEGLHPMSQVKVSYSLDGAPFIQPQPLSSTEDKQTIECKWNEAATLDIKVRLDGLTLKNTDGLKFSFDGATVSSEAIPFLSYSHIFEVTGAPQPLETRLAAVLDTAFGNIPGYQATIKVDYFYPMSLLGDDIHKTVTVPVLLSSSLSLDQASRSARVKAIAQTIRDWYQGAHPPDTKAGLSFLIQLYRPPYAAPILDLAKVCILREAISDL